MPAIALSRHLPRATAAGLLVGALVLAEGLTARAGGADLRPSGPGPAWPSGAVPLRGAAQVPRASVAPPAPFPTVPADRMRPLPVAVQAAAAAADPPPFAPGGDDILGGEPSDPVRPMRLHNDAARLAAWDGGPSGPGSPWMALPGLPAPAAPAVRLWLDHTLGADGPRVRLNVVTTGGGACRLTGALQGRSLPPDGRLELPGLAPGRHQVGVACRTGQGLVEQGLTLVVPLPVLPGSEANRRAYGEGAAARSGLRELGLGVGEAERFAAGDFLQEGRVALFGLAEGGSGRVQVLGVDAAGRWADRTAELLPWPDERRSCAGARQVLSADLNRDGLPDVYIACDEAPAVLFLSQPGGPYRRVDGVDVAPGLPTGGLGGPVELADADGDALVDLVRPATAAGASAVLLGRGRGDGSFAAP